MKIEDPILHFVPGPQIPGDGPGRDPSQSSDHAYCAASGHLAYSPVTNSTTAGLLHTELPTPAAAHPLSSPA